MKTKIEKIKERCFDRSTYPLIIEDTWGEDIQGKEFYTDKCDRPRKLKLEITSYKYLCWDARHFYGKLKNYGPHIRKYEDNKCYGGYLGDDTNLFRNIGIEIELWRYVTKEEKKNEPNRYNDKMNVTYGWLTKEDLIQFAQEVFQERFKGSWALEIDDKTFKPHG